VSARRKPSGLLYSKTLLAAEQDSSGTVHNRLYLLRHDRSFIIKNSRAHPRNLTVKKVFSVTSALLNPQSQLNAIYRILYNYCKIFIYLMIPKNSKRRRE